MATLYSVLGALQAQVSLATTGLISTAIDTFGKPLDVMVGIGMPSERTLQNNVRKSPNPSAVISVWDRGLASDTTRWLPHRLGYLPIPATVQAELSASVLTQAAPVTVTMSGPVGVGDGVGLCTAIIRNEPWGAVVTGAAGDTPESMAARLAAQINADPAVSVAMTATAAGPVVTLAAKIPGPIRLACNVGNGASEVMEIGRRSRGLQIVLWTRTENDQNIIGDVIEIMIAKMEADFGLTFPDGSMGRLKFGGDHLLPNATLADTYRRDFLVSVDYPITVPRQLYTVLVAVIQQSNVL
jgi:hypothetical protein